MGGERIERQQELSFANTLCHGEVLICIPAKKAQFALTSESPEGETGECGDKERKDGRAGFSPVGE
jgi:hypothetical protein